MQMAPQETRTYFVTTVAAQRRAIFQTTSNATLLQETLLHYRQQHKYQLHSFVIMPDHLHLLLTPAPEISLEKAMQLIKGGFSFRLKRSFDVWMRGFNEVQLLDPDRCLACIRYIEENPVRKRLALDSKSFPFSSASYDGLDPLPPHLRG